MSSESSRRAFIKTSLGGLGTTILSGFTLLDKTYGGRYINKHSIKEIFETDDLFFKISLAQWSLHRSYNKKELKVEEFPVIAKKQYDIHAVEYVNSFYSKYANDSAFWKALYTRAEDNGVKNLIIMVDEEGDLGNPNDNKRKKAIQNHFKWVEAAKILDCHSIRINGFGEGSRETVGNALVDGMGMLGEYAVQAGINVVIENHGLFSSDGKWVLDVLRRIGRDNCGTLPDFGNFCTARKWGSTQDGTCPEEYDRYLGVKEMMPFAKGVSVKSYRFDEHGQETTIDFGRMLQIVKEAGFTGYIGIEYEGNELSESKGILATKKLLIEEGSKI
jgi:sugar phosphate isomerase/epimerase